VKQIVSRIPCAPSGSNRNKPTQPTIQRTRAGATPNSVRGDRKFDDRPPLKTDKLSQNFITINNMKLLDSVEKIGIGVLKFKTVFIYTTA
jgi:hypothetical protein